MAIRDLIAAMGKRDQEQAANDKAACLRLLAGRHSISNIVLKITGGKAVERAYWFHYREKNLKERPLLIPMATTKMKRSKQTASGYSASAKFTTNR